MRFPIERASTYLYRDDERSPVDGAVRSEDGCWTIEIDSLDALLALAEREGQLIVAPTYDGRKPWAGMAGRSTAGPWITIYDDYVE